MRRWKEHRSTESRSPIGSGRHPRASIAAAAQSAMLPLVVCALFFGFALASEGSNLISAGSGGRFR